MSETGNYIKIGKVRIWIWIWISIYSILVFEKAAAPRNQCCFSERIRREQLLHTALVIWQLLLPQELSVSYSLYFQCAEMT